MKDKLAALGTFCVSILLSFCCTIPLALASLGLGSLGLGAFVKPLRPWLIGAALVFIGTGIWRVHARASDRKSRALMWTAAAVFLVSVGTPYVVGFLRGGPAGELPYVPGPDERPMVVVIEGRVGPPCAAGCESQAQLALKALPGVRHVRVDHARGEAHLSVRKDSVPPEDEIRRVLRAVGHEGRLRR
jgi:hypothetical protein